MSKLPQSQLANSAADAAVKEIGNPVPKALGFRFPAEWEPQAAVWLSWPHKRSTWPGRFRPIPAKLAEIVAQISRFEEARINCTAVLQPRARRLCAAAGADMARVTFYDHPTNDAWCRDHGPIFVKNDRTGEVALTDWRYNAWGGKYPPYDLDHEIPRRVARKLGLRRFENDMVLEGGSIDVNGRGLLLTSEQCLLHQNRNPHLSRGQIEQNLRDFLGVKTVLWVGEGIAGDDTDGHIDDMTRFYKADGIITCVESNGRDANHRVLAENLGRVRSFRTPAGRPFDLVPLPMPRAFGFQGRRVPASYANFLIINGAVLVPTFQQKRRDAEAGEIIGGCFPGREVIPIDCRDLVWGLGALHCISQQQPASAKPVAELFP
ncbi:MAG: agmatine deiminase family protein [Verrucomicrobia bacterium]|nr:agmatine deiminase family protein [Verrucomicrobiota bacterium]